MAYLWVLIIRFFLADTDSGLYSYNYNGNSFTKLAHTSNIWSPYNLSIGNDNTIFLASWDEGLFAYSYSGFSNLELNFDSTPDKYFLSQNYPNPFNSVTTIKYTIKNPGFVKIEIFDIAGKKVQTLVNQFQKPNSYTVKINRNDLASGLYFYRLKIGKKYYKSKKMIFLKWLYNIFKYIYIFNNWKNLKYLIHKNAVDNLV